MPAPPVWVTATRESEDSTLWVGFQLASLESACAALLRVASLEATLFSADCRPLMLYSRVWMRVVLWRSIAISWSTMLLVSTPEAIPESETPMARPPPRP